MAKDIKGFIEPRSDEGLSATDQSIAGSIAKCVTKLVLYPLDTLKSRTQASTHGGLNEFRHLSSVTGIYRGLAPKLLLYTPYQAVYMAVYVQAREQLLAGPFPFGPSSPLTFVAAGITAEVSASAVRLPMEVVKLRLQLGIYQNSWHAFKDFAQHPGRLYRGNFVPQTLVHDCAYSAFAWMIFEYSRQWLFSRRGSSELPAHENLALGTFTGGVTALVTNPLDVLKTRIIGRRQDDRFPPLGLLHTARGILRDEGALAFWRGAGFRVAHLAPSHGLYMLLYEVAKLQLATWRTVGGS
ncbi:unnamed protein product [Polarella glacialis]|uniref:Mitochondrial carrier protein n=1 Tax=Polarella glacialis TaxID=89957 RepID=A0A813GHW7_POLGL|nr:unnamed protein product [Polarella glacialis]CAE8669193.1 unnamed protein product [Polarella glacialis]